MVNPIPHYVVEVLSRPYSEHGFWWLKVKASCHGHTSESVLMFMTKEAALTVRFGYCFIG